jgi:hypothetical protein
VIFNKLNNTELSFRGNFFIKGIITLMTLNWAFLFAVTYGKYGWDVGEPLSYLTNIGVDLLAMLGIFSVKEKVEQLAVQDTWSYKALKNVNSQAQLARWRYEYFRKRL